MREVENLPFGPTARWTSLNLVGSFDGPPGPRVSDLAWATIERLVLGQNSNSKQKQP